MSDVGELRRLRREPLWTPSEEHRAMPAVASLLPHRAPMLLVDEVTHVSATDAAVRATFTAGAQLPVFEGHFPGAPVYPGVLVVESMCQALLCLFALTGGVPHGASPRLSRIVETVFLAPVLPGDVIELLARSTGADEVAASGVAQARVRGTVAALGRFDVVWTEGHP